MINGRVNAPYQETLPVSLVLTQYLPVMRGRWDFG